MGRNERQLVKALQQQYVTPLQVRMAATILACNGIDVALEYVGGLTIAAPDQAIVPLEAAEHAYLEDIADGIFFANPPGG